MRSPVLRRLAPTLVLLVLVPLLPAGAASAATPPAGPPVPSRVVVQLDVGFTPPGLLTASGRARQADRLAAVRARVQTRAKAAGARGLRTYGSIPFVALEATPAALRTLQASGDVAAVHADERHQVSLASSAPHIGAPAAWAAGLTGSGQSVAVLDTGIETSHPFLTGKVVAEACFTSSSTCPNGGTSQIGPGAAAPCTFDDRACPHGTHVAGIVAGVGPASAGVARGATLIGVQVMSRATSGCRDGAASCATGWTSDLLAGLDHVATLSGSRPIAAVNLSLGGGSYTGACDSQQPALKKAVDALRSLGIATVASAGNEGSSSSMSSPACLSGAVAVGSTSLGDGVSAFSNSSPQLSLLAPGEQILSSYTGGRSAWMTGTSQAAPHVAGAVAVLRSARPTSSVASVIGALTSTGVPVTDPRNGRVTPRVRVDAALTALPVAQDVEPALEPEQPAGDQLVSSPSPSPSVSRSPSPSPSPSPSVSGSPSPSPSVSRSPSPSASPPPVAGPAPSVSLIPTAAPAPPGPAEDAGGVSTRLSGDDRYSTAADIYSAAFGCDQGGASSAVLARGDAFADALAGSYLSGVHGTGVLLTGTGSVPAATLAALRDSGARTVHLLGGTAAISDAVVAQLARTPSYDCTGSRGANLTVTRVSGSNRFDTARRIAEHAGAAAVGTADLTGRPLRTAVVASGLGFADALAAGPLSYAGAGDGGFPMLLTAPGALSPEAETALESLGIEQVVIPGGTAVVSTAVERRLTSLGLKVVRVAGSSRTETAAMIAAFAVDELGFPATGVALARGDAFADALAGAAYAGDRRLPLLLTAGPTVLSSATSSYLRAADETTVVTAFGGTGAISAGTLAEALRHLIA